eukprot:188944-Chlamydomonas_euryale.AAC.2
MIITAASLLVRRNRGQSEQPAYLRRNYGQSGHPACLRSHMQRWRMLCICKEWRATCHSSGMSRVSPSTENEAARTLAARSLHMPPRERGRQGIPLAKHTAASAQAS